MKTLGLGLQLAALPVLVVALLEAVVYSEPPWTMALVVAGVAMSVFGALITRVFDR